MCVEAKDERRHFFERVDPAFWRRTVRGSAVNRDFKPHDAVVPTTHRGTLATFHHDGVVGLNRRVLHEPTGAQRGIGFLVGSEGNLDVHARHGARGLQRFESHEQARDRALHVGRAPAKNPTTLNRPAKRTAVAPATRNRHDIVMRVKMNRLRRAAHAEFTEDVVTRKSKLGGGQ